MSVGNVIVHKYTGLTEHGTRDEGQQDSPKVGDLFATQYHSNSSTSCSDDGHDHKREQDASFARKIVSGQQARSSSEDNKRERVHAV